jgi:hypothetical protein
MSRRWLDPRALTVLCLAACTRPEAGAATEVVVVVYSDEALEPRLRRVTVEVRDDLGERAYSQHSFVLGEDSPLPLSFGVVQPPNGAEWFMLVTEGLGDDDALLVRHKVIAHFEARRTGVLQVYLASACVGELCDGQADLSCYGETGMCGEIARVRPSLDGDAATAIDTDTAVTDTAGDAGAEDASLSTEGRALPPVGTTFSSGGGRRGDGALSVFDDGFDAIDRRCTRDGMFCVTGGFGP